jgi:hypothetical protein
VSLVFALRRGLRASEASFYVLAQLAGAVVGTITAHAMFLSWGRSAEDGDGLSPKLPSFRANLLMAAGPKASADGSVLGRFRDRCGDTGRKRDHRQSPAPSAIGEPFSLTPTEGSTVTDQTYAGKWKLIY